jgi:Uma2 family endonuclease
MIPSRPARYHYTYAEYLAYESDSGMKHEYDGGEIVAMAGGSRRHSALASRISAALEVARRPGCVAFQSDLRIRVTGDRQGYLPRCVAGARCDRGRSRRSLR